MGKVYLICMLVRKLLVGLTVAILIGSCSAVDNLVDRLYPDLQEEETPALLMTEGMEHFENGRYEAATETFQKITERYPYSKYAITAEIKMADALYNRDLYEEAFEAYSEFERLHPKNKNIPYVIYQKAMCHFNQVSTIDRDQSPTLQAKEEFERLVRKFSRHEYAGKARIKIRECDISLADYELYVGRFYYKRKKYRAAMGRFRYILENYPDRGQYQEALEYLRKCKEKLSKEQEKT